MNTPNTWNVKQVAAFFGVSTATIRRNSNAGKFLKPVNTMSKDHRWDVEQVKAFYEMQRTKAVIK